MSFSQVRCLLVALMFIFQSSVFSSELATGGSSKEIKRSNTSLKSSENESVVEANACSGTLKKWVEDDFKDKRGMLVVNLPSYAKSACMGPLTEAQNKMQNRTPAGEKPKKTDLGEAEKFNTYLAEKYPQIAPSAKSAISSCNALTDGEDVLVKARYYKSMSKLESYSNSVVDELAFIDSVLPEPGKGLSQVECNKNFPFPKMADRCETYKKKMAEKCDVTPEQRFEQMAKRSVFLLDQIKDLKEGKKACRQAGKSEDACVAFDVIRERIEGENPWLNSAEFRNLNNEMVGVSYGRGGHKIKAGSTEQREKQARLNLTHYLKNTREALEKAHKSNMEHARCLTFNESKSTCDFEKTRDLISKIPNVPTPNAEGKKKSTSDRKFDTHLEVEQCVAQASESQMEAKAKMDMAGELVATGALMLATSGLAAVGAGGLKVMRGMSVINRVRSASLATAASVALNLSAGVAQAVKSCSTERDALVQFSSQPEALKANVCQDLGSKFEQLKDAENSCMTDALLTSVDILPFVKGLKNLTQYRKFSREELLALYKNPAQREAVEKILAKNGQLLPAERIEGAEALLGRQLSATERNCVMAAHEVGANRVMRTVASAGLSDDKILQQNDLNQKKDALRKCPTIETVEIALLMRSGITGSAVVGKELLQKNMLQAQKLVESVRQSPIDRYSGSPFSMLGDAQKASGDIKAMEATYKEGFNIELKALGIDKMNPQQAKARLESLSSNDLDRLSKFAAAKGDPAWIEAVEKANFKRIEATYDRSRYPSSLEGIKLSKAHQEDAIYEYYRELKKLASSADPIIKKMGQSRIEVLKKAYPGIRD